MNLYFDRCRGSESYSPRQLGMVTGLENLRVANRGQFLAAAHCGGRRTRQGSLQKILCIPCVVEEQVVVGFRLGI